VKSVKPSWVAQNTYGPAILRNDDPEPQRHQLGRKTQATRYPDSGVFELFTLSFLVIHVLPSRLPFSEWSAALSPGRSIRQS
jgi:hypothetical protein